MLGERIAKLRKQRNLSQYDLAERLGFSRGKLANYEQGSRQPDYDTLQKIADYFEVSTDYLLGRTNIPDGSVELNEDNFDSLEEINKLVKKYGIEQMGFFDIEEWKSLGPDDVRLVEEHFKMIVKLAKERNREKD